MYRLYLYIIIGCCAACTGNFRDMNRDKAGMTEEEMQIDFNQLGFPLGVIQQGIYFNYDYGKGKNWPYQIMQNLSADMFSGYMHDYKPLNGGSHNSDYNLQDGWNGTFWENTYAYIFPQIKKSEDACRDSFPDFYAVTKILKVFVMHRVSDYYGPIVYRHFGQEKTAYQPDTQQQAYSAFFQDLDTAVHLLACYIDENPGECRFAKFDLLTDGTCEAWIKMANSLRLRLAVRLAVADPEKARRECGKALENKYGVLKDPGEIIAVSTREGYVNPLGEINQVWGEVFLNASMESILNGYQDPRREKFFTPCPEDVVLTDKGGRDSVVFPLKGQYRGIRQGTLFSHTYYASHSRIYVSQTTAPVLMTAAEMWFLRAEAALRGWTEENAADCYRKGVKVSFSQWGIPDAENYLMSDRTAADYEDVYTPSNNIAARCKVSPRWEAEASAEVKLEKIITQKWLAIFPEGCEAWAEQRRTGYPRLFPVRYNNSKNASIDTEVMIRRLNFPVSLQDSDVSLYQALCTALGAEDNGGSRLWWDRGRNF